MAISKSDIKFYLTSVEPDISQSNKSQSIGGYRSTSELYANETLAADVALYDTKMKLSAFANVKDLSYVNINHEIIETNVIDSTTMTVKNRAINNSTNFHATSDRVFGLTIDHLFDQRFNSDLKQYRCVAIRNEHSSDSALSVAVYLKQNVINTSSLMKMALEIPLNDYHSGTATGGTKMSLINSSLSSFVDNHFKDAVLKLTGGLNVNQSRTVTSYDKSSGTFVLDSSLPFNVSSGDAYEVAPGPAQRIVSGLVSPTFGSGRVSVLSEAGISDSVDIDVNSDRDSGDDLKANDVIYVWLERSLVKDSEAYPLNSSILTINYFTA